MGVVKVKRLRPAYTPEELADIYATPHDHRGWQDHKERVQYTIQMALMIRGGAPHDIIADLSCGDATIPNAIPARRRHLGDYAQGYEYTGPIEETINHIPHVDLFVCCETLEHVDDPVKVLTDIRGKANHLVLSTPLDEQVDNPQHYWSWDKDDIHQLLTDTGWTPRVYGALTFKKLNGEGFQTWLAS